MGLQALVPMASQGCVISSTAAVARRCDSLCPSGGEDLSTSCWHWLAGLLNAMRAAFSAAFRSQVSHLSQFLVVGLPLGSSRARLGKATMDSLQGRHFYSPWAGQRENTQAIGQLFHPLREL